MRRSNLLTLRKYFNWNSSWYDKYQYQELILRDTIFYVYLISLFKILKIPTSMFKINHFSTSIIYIECDIYVRWTYKILKYVKSFFQTYLSVWDMFKTLFHTKKRRLSLDVHHHLDNDRSYQIAISFRSSTFFKIYLKAISRNTFFFSSMDYINLKQYHHLCDYIYLFIDSIWLGLSKYLNFFSIWYFFKKNKHLFKHSLHMKYSMVNYESTTTLQESFFSQQQYFSIRPLVRLWSTNAHKWRKKMLFEQYYANSFLDKAFVHFPDLRILFRYTQIKSVLKKHFFFQYFQLENTPFLLYPENTWVMFSKKRKYFLHHLYRLASKKKGLRRKFYDKNSFFYWYIDISLNYILNKLKTYYFTYMSLYCYESLEKSFSFLFAQHNRLHFKRFSKSKKISYFLFKNSFQLKALYLYCSVSQRFYYVSRIFKFYFFIEFFSQLNSKLEFTFRTYSGTNSLYLFMPNLFFLYKPYITSAKLICDFVFFKLKNRCSLNRVYKSVKVWQLKERSLIFYSFQKSIPNISEDKKEHSKSLLEKTAQFKKFVHFRIPLLGIRILLTGPPYKARRKIKKYYHLWVANHAITGNMPLQTFNLVMDYYQTAIILRRASLGLKVWLLFESYKELK